MKNAFIIYCQIFIKMVKILGEKSQDFGNFGVSRIFEKFHLGHEPCSLHKEHNSVFWVLNSEKKIYYRVNLVLKEPIKPLLLNFFYHN